MRISRQLWAATLLVVTAGCQSVPQLLDVPPIRPAGAAVVEDENPVFLPHGPTAYPIVFENVLQVLSDFGFEIQDSNRWDGRIEAAPRIAPGLALFLKPGSPDLRERLLSTLQTYRHRVSVEILPAENGGFYVKVTARRELEDLPRPIRSTVGAAIFRTDNNVERQFEVIDPTFYEETWISRGRDVALEQELIRRIKSCQVPPGLEGVGVGP